MSTAAAPPQVAEPEEKPDERLGKNARLAAVLRRPEVGAIVAALIVFLYFALSTEAFALPSGASTWVFTSSSFAIMAVAVALLMIGGEFDLSAGAMTGFTGLITGIMMTHYHANVWVAVFASLAAALAVGFVNGVLVMKTGLPSFIVTLGTFFILQGVNAGGTLKITGTVAINGIDEAPGFDSARPFFASSLWSPYDFKVNVIWWFGLTVAGVWLLARTRFGNWIYAVGGDPVAARNVGVPVARTKIALFMMTSTTAALLGIITAIGLRGIQANEGVGREFIFIIAAVVGGCLLTGGYGSVIGTAFGAAILGMAGIGIILSNWDSNWVYAFQGVILVLAVMLNAAIRSRAARVRSR
jgi:simple sugar transport system permease protein